MPLTYLTRDPQATRDGFAPAFALACGLLGVLVSRRQPRNPQGWLLLALAVGVIAVLAVGLLANEAGTIVGRHIQVDLSGAYSGPGSPSGVLGVLAAIAGAAFILAPPFWPGILKYHLYDIDRLISRTLSYALVTGLLVGVYIAGVTLATGVLPFTSPVAVAASTLAAAAPFHPLRHRVQRAVDRRFNRTRYNAEVTVAMFAERLKDAVDLDAVRDDLASVVHQALEPAHVSVWMRRQGTERIFQTNAEPATVKAATVR